MSSGILLEPSDGTYNRARLIQLSQMLKEHFEFVIFDLPCAEQNDWLLPDRQRTRWSCFEHQIGQGEFDSRVTDAARNENPRSQCAGCRTEPYSVLYTWLSANVHAIQCRGIVVISDSLQAHEVSVEQRC